MPLPASDITRNGGGGGGGAGGGAASETDNVTALELHSGRRMLHFSDGVMEELSSGSEDETEAADVTDQSYAVQLDEREMAFGPRLRYKASRMGNRFLAGIDYVGGGLASLLGITSSKYASELENNQRRAKEEQDLEDLDNWQPRQPNNNNNNNRNETLVLTRSEASLPPTRQ